MKSKEELNALKIEVEDLNKKLAELSEEELNVVAGGMGYEPDSDYGGICGDNSKSVIVGMANPAARMTEEKTEPIQDSIVLLKKIPEPEI